jgi:hypothetical protein
MNRLIPLRGINYVYRMILILVLIGLSSVGRSQDYFVDVSEGSGIDHYFITYQGTFGGGVAVLDFNNDGHEDLFIAGGAGSNALYQNNGDGSFTNIIDKAGFEDLDTLVTQGATTADVNKDGYVDIFITAISSKNGGTRMEAPDLLYINNGDGTFSNKTITYGLDKERKFSTGATFGDINQDGYPDLFVGVFFENFSGRLDQYSGLASSKSPPAWDLLYINKEGKYFEEKSYDYNLHYIGLGFGGVFTDYDNDRDLDLLVFNDFGYKFTPNKLFRNEFPKKKFTDVSEQMGMDFGMSAMGIAVGDYNNDGWFDYFFSNILNAPLAVNQGLGKPFLDLSNELGASIRFLTNKDGQPIQTISWGVNFLDFDNDTDVDLFINMGSLNPDEKPIPNVLLINDSKKFTQAGLESGLNDTYIGRGSVTFDYDNDGDLDLFIVNQASVSANYENFENLSSRLYRNDAATGNWIKIKLEGSRSDANGIGSRVEVYTDNVLMTREIDGGSSHESQNSKIAHFGMNESRAADSIIVKWTSTVTQTLYDVKVNQTITLQEPFEFTTWQKFVLFLFSLHYV